MTEKVVILTGKVVIFLALTTFLPPQGGNLPPFSLFVPLLISKIKN
jgi:hypothetical protein